MSVDDVPSVATLPTPYGAFRIEVVTDDGGLEHVALSMGDLRGPDPVLVRVHSEFLFACQEFSSFHTSCF